MTRQDDKPFIVCENLVRIYKVADLEIVALQGLDLIVQRGEMLGIVGNSGSGKTTLLNILGGLDRPSAGRVTVDGVDLLSLSEQELNVYQRRKVGFVWQQTSRNLIPYLTAQENVELPMTMAWTRGLRAKRAWSDELLNAVGLYERRKHRLAQLSGGEQQRVAIAVALANKPALLLGDEPTGEVDSATAQIIMDTFCRLGDLLNLTIIIVTHDPRIARQVDRVVAIQDGKISTETVRRMTPPVTASPPVGFLPTATPAATYHEYVVLDSAGRLQLPREWLEELGIGKRAQLELVGDTIRIRPASDQGQPKARRLSLEEQLALLFAEEPQPARPSIFRRLSFPWQKRRF